ncbi:hypothetical protein [Okeania sp. SIO3B5]|nr:hypothetical protein [Okeania sp. SIO3B5]
MANFVEYKEKNQMKLYGVIEVEIPQYYGEVILRLNAVIAD